MTSYKAQKRRRLHGARRSHLRLKLHALPKKHPTKFHIAHASVQLVYHVSEFSQGHSMASYLGGAIAILTVYGFVWKGEYV